MTDIGIEPLRDAALSIAVERPGARECLGPTTQPSGAFSRRARLQGIEPVTVEAPPDHDAGSRLEAAFLRARVKLKP
jgi:hypothetical protein